MLNKNALVLYSGGQDSTTVLYWAMKEYENVYALGFDYGQKHKIELEKAKLITERLGIEFKIIKLDSLFLDSSLLNNNLEHTERNKYNINVNSAFVNGRNLLFILLTTIQSNSYGDCDIVTGICQMGDSNYPDCKNETLISLQETLRLGFGKTEINIINPLMFKTKAEIWKMAKDLNCLDVIINDTITDYNGSTIKNEWGYGIDDNPSTILRKRGYYEAKEKGWL